MGMAKEMSFASVAANDEPETLYAPLMVRLAEPTLAGFHMLYLATRHRPLFGLQRGSTHSQLGCDSHLWCLRLNLGGNSMP